MTTYIIDYTDPLKSRFSIEPFGFNGPGGLNSATTLRLYGRGALNWGEAVDEDLVRLLENFYGSTPPLNPTDGQHWRGARLYWHDSTAAAQEGWYVYNISGKTWELIGTTGVLPDSPPSPIQGNMYFDPVDEKLYLYDSLYKQQTPAWIAREYTTRAAAPTTERPEEFWLAWSSNRNEWVIDTRVHVDPNQPTSGITQTGVMWLEGEEGTLYVFDGSIWRPLVYGDDDIGLPFQEYHLPDSDNAASIRYVNTAIVQGGGDLFVNVSGDTMTGFLTLHSDPVDPMHAATKQYAVAKAGDTMAGFLTLHAEPVNDRHAATKKYIDDLLADQQGSGVQGWCSFNPGNGNLYDSYNLVVSRVGAGDYVITIDPSVRKSNSNYTVVVSSPPQHSWTQGRTDSSGALDIMTAGVYSRAESSFRVRTSRKRNSSLKQVGYDDTDRVQTFIADLTDPPTYLSVMFMWNA